MTSGPSTSQHSNSSHLLCPFCPFTQQGSLCGRFLSSCLFSYWEDLSAFVGFHSSNNIPFITTCSRTWVPGYPSLWFHIIKSVVYPQQAVLLISMVTGQGSSDHKALAQTQETEIKRRLEISPCSGKKSSMVPNGV